MIQGNKTGGFELSGVFYKKSKRIPSQYVELNSNTAYKPT